MSFFESLLVLLLVAILLLQVSRRLALPYPAMLATAGVIVALIPGSPDIAIDPQLALALFIAPVLMDAAFDFPAGAVRRLWQPLFALAVVAVVVTTATVAWLAWAWAGLPLAAAVVMGAIVAPPDAAAATAVLRNLSLPRRTLAVLKGESLLNDALALLLFSGGVAIQQSGGLDLEVGARLAIAAPGGLLLGIVLAFVLMPLMRFVRGTLGGTIMEFVSTFWVWVIAEHLGLSAVLCVVAYGMTVAYRVGMVQTVQTARMRVHSFAVWETVVFALNVLAFLMMGMQARSIVGGMEPARLEEALVFAGVVVVVVIAVRLTLTVGYNRLSARFASMRAGDEPPTLRQGLIVGWCGMRGLVTLATAFALPDDFPERDLIVLCAFAVVLGTLALQGLSLVPLIRLLGLDGSESIAREVVAGRIALANAGLKSLEGETAPEAEQLRVKYRDALSAADGSAADAFETRRRIGLAAIRAERAKLDRLRLTDGLAPETYLALQEELDWRELAIAAEDDRRIEEG